MTASAIEMLETYGVAVRGIYPAPTGNLYLTGSAGALWKLVDGVPLVGLGQLVFGGHEVRPGDVESADAERFLMTIVRESDRLARLADDLLTLQRIEARPLVLELERPIVARIASISDWPVILIDIL